MIPIVQFTRSNGATIYVNANNVAYIVAVGELQTRLVFAGGHEPAHDAVIVNEDIASVAGQLKFTQ